MSTEKWLWPYPGTGPANLSRGWQSNHKGIDIVKAGNPHHYVIATKSGRVERAYHGCVNHSGANPADYRPCAAAGCPAVNLHAGYPFCNYDYGNGVILRHAEQAYSHYAHFEEIFVSEGQEVYQGQIIGTVGSSGESTGPHLHFSLAQGPLAATRFYNDPVGYTASTLPERDLIDYAYPALVRFDAAGGKADISSRYYAMMEPYGSLPTPLRSGFIFGGWWTEPNSESYAVSKAMKRESGSLVPYIPDQTLYAHWLVKVTYDAGGIAPATVFVPADGTNGSGRYKISAKVPERKGHAFKGWADDSGRLYQPGQEITGIGADIALRAQWTPIEHTLRFRAEQGGALYYSDGALAAQGEIAVQVAEGGNYTVPFYTGRPLHKFMGWQRKGQALVFKPGNTISGIYADLSYDPVFEPLTFVLHYDTAQGEPLSPTAIPYAQLSFENGEGRLPLSPLPTPVRPGYTFAGWREVGTDAPLYQPGPGFFPVCKTYYLTAVWSRATQTPPAPAGPPTEADFSDPRTQTGEKRWVKTGMPYAFAYSQDGSTYRREGFPDLPDQLDGRISDGWTDDEGGKEPAAGRPVTPATLVPAGQRHRLSARWIEADRFQDLAGFGWAAASIYRCFSRGLMFGTGEHTFSPAQTATRGEATTVLFRMEGSPQGGGNEFYDVPAGHFAEKAVTWVKSAGLLAGKAPYFFGLQDAMQRQHMILLLYRYAGYKGIDTQTGTAPVDLSRFTDRHLVSDYCLDAVKWGVKTGIVSGTTATTLDPKGPLNRAELAAFIMRLSKHLSDAETAGR